MGFFACLSLVMMLSILWLGAFLMLDFAHVLSDALGRGFLARVLPIVSVPSWFTHLCLLVAL